ncbi:N-acetylglucosamine kinase-like BadF-type ATPase [Streptomyces olivoverticillatus]|uniref:N-acetylglucosamine kinase-like BadF-type ATPase n=1 Tax=Streptomyces olivoverticillatus TaxID=66427 RepID=A0A7W7PLZ0_9ACTN|nr:BadF/BadG/BcrA/BcrD ATPase family protein [Streptomyces olivoverticillatus]MBB4893285.1 N-acetylglucosamine kinase-like BadF-type ATPase [Streptomyces olivoverticillatus]
MAVLGVDSGGSGLRLALAADGGPALTWSTPVPVETGARGIDAGAFLDRMLPAARELLRRAGSRRCEAVCVGASGMSTLGRDLRAVLPGALREALGVHRLALASDAVTAYAGALGQRPGAVVAAGTGLVALGTDLTPDGGWRRADGWGHLLGDCGSGAWIGRAGLEAAMRAHDGRNGGSAPLLKRLEAVFGPAGELPGRLYPRADRPAVLASFAPEVGRCAADDPIAADILRTAARHIAETAAAVCPGPAGPAAPAGISLALTGGLFRMGEPLLTPLQVELQKQIPYAVSTERAGDPLHGALAVARALTTDSLTLPVDGSLLCVVC